MSSSKKALRCTIYTRKSSDEGIDQDFNNLHAQRETCEAYIVSQRSEGWTLIPDQYDDGGCSGGTLERHALQTLLADIEAGRVDVVVVYKIDRLTRSLTDFSKLVEVLERNGATFVSVTQSFNTTTTSMGRLMLNVLLSFAQFEREVTGERIRDKIAASKKRGLWMGGRVPTGYKVENRALVIDEAEAEIIRSIFGLYLELKNVRLVAEALRARGIASGGGKALSRGHIYKLLGSPLYIGKVEHKGESYNGQHQSIIDKATWDAVQAQLAANTRGKRSRPNIKEPSLLAGLLFDDQDRSLAPTHAVKAGRRYRYYAVNADSEAGGTRLPSRGRRGRAGGRDAHRRLSRADRRADRRVGCGRPPA